MEGRDRQSPETKFYNVPPEPVRFVARAETLETLHRLLTSASNARGTLIGMPGIGKTQTALRYVYSYAGAFSAVAWIRADSRDEITSGYAELASLLGIGTENRRPSEIIRAITTMLDRQAGWLLVFDNVDDPQVLDGLRPAASSGRLLLTSRNPASALIAPNPIILPPLSPEEGGNLLLSYLPPSAAAEASDAQEISRRVDGLPLALSQAGAYMLTTGTGCRSYCSLLDADEGGAGIFLEEVPGISQGSLTPSVFSALSIAFERVREQNPAAAELLMMLAFLAPDAIPEEIFIGKIQGNSAPMAPFEPLLPDALRQSTATPVGWNKTLAVPLGLSLIQRDSGAGILSVHRISQCCWREVMGVGPDGRDKWAKQTVEAVAKAFPLVRYDSLPFADRLLPQAIACAELIERHHIFTPLAARLLHQTGVCLSFRAAYERREEFYLKALATYRKMGPDGMEVSRVMRDLGWSKMHRGLMRKQWEESGREEPGIAKNLFGEAWALFSEARELRERLHGPRHPSIAEILSDMAALRSREGNYPQSERLFTEALALRRTYTDAGAAANVATTLNDFGRLRRSQGRYAEAEQMFHEALSIREAELGPDRPEIASIWNNLGALYHDLGATRRQDALRAYDKALAIRTAVLGAEHPDTVRTMENKAYTLYALGQREEAERLHNEVAMVRGKFEQPT